LARRPPLFGDLRSWALIGADSLELLAALPDHCIDAVVTDPPYGLGFQDEAWDSGPLASGDGFQAFCTAWGRQARRVLRPGGFVAAFGAPRTFHRLVCGVEDAGLEVRDQLLWLHGRGMPKSGHLLGGRSTTLKPAYEPILLARAPLDRGQTASDSLERYGTGALNISATRLPRGGVAGATGYWPSHVLLGHSVGCHSAATGCQPGCVVPLVDRLGPPGRPPLSRLFYAAKATSAEREAGCETLARSTAAIFSGTAGGVRPRANLHPTVKPLDLMRWLVRLVTPIGGVVLDPFAGSGSTGCGAVLEGRQFVGIEREATYLPIARARLTHWATLATDRPLAERNEADASSRTV